MEETGDLKKITDSHQLNINRKMNKVYLEQAEVRRELYGNEIPKNKEDNTGINFEEWDKNLKGLEVENKILLQAEKEQELNEKKEIKQEKLKKEKFDEQVLLEKGYENVRILSYQLSRMYLILIH